MIDGLLLDVVGKIIAMALPTFRANTSDNPMFLQEQSVRFGF